MALVQTRKRFTHGERKPGRLLSALHRGFNLHDRVVDRVAQVAGAELEQ